MDSKQPHLRPETIAITAGRPEVGADSALNPPISLNSTYVAGGPVGYGRYGNETWTALEVAISALEGGKTLSYSSGMAAISAVFSTLPVGAKVVASDQGYSGIMTLLGTLNATKKINAKLVTITDTAEVIAALDGADLLWLESPTNPSLDIADLPTLIKEAKSRNILVTVDNTFATALIQQPLAMLASDLFQNFHDVVLWADFKVNLGCLFEMTKAVFDHLIKPLGVWIIHSLGEQSQYRSGPCHGDVEIIRKNPFVLGFVMVYAGNDYHFGIVSLERMRGCHKQHFAATFKRLIRLDR